MNKSDADTREFGGTIETVLNSDEVEVIDL
jgi:hypothetical protein